MTDMVVSARPTHVPVGREVDDLVRVAHVLNDAGIYRKTAKSVPEMFAVLMAARDMGVSSTAALAGGIHMVEGKPEVSANLQAQLLREYRGPEGQRYDYRVLTPARERSKECHLEFRRFLPGQDQWEDGETVGEEFFDIEDAKRAALAGKDNWKKYPKMMLLARCLSDGIASHCPETARGLRVYGEGEIGGPPPGPPLDEPAVDVHSSVNGAAKPVAERPANVDDNGEIVDAQVVPDEPQGEQPTAQEPERTVPVATAQQRRLLHAKKKEWGLTDDQLRQALRDVSGSPHTDRLPKDQVDDVLAAMETMAAEQAAGVAA